MTPKRVTRYVVQRRFEKFWTDEGMTQTIEEAKLRLRELKRIDLDYPDLPFAALQIIKRTTIEEVVG